MHGVFCIRKLLSVKSNQDSVLPPFLHRSLEILKYTKKFEGVKEFILPSEIKNDNI